MSEGTISFGGQDVTDLSRRGWERLYGTAVGAVFQDPASYLNPNLTVGGQLAEVLRVKQRMARADAHRKTVELFAAVGLHGGADQVDDRLHALKHIATCGGGGWPLRVARRMG